MSLDKLLASPYSTGISKEENINKFIDCVNSAIKNKLEAGIMTKTDGKILRKMLIRIRTDTNLLNAIKEFNIAFSTLDLIWTIGATSILNDNMDSSVKLASLLALIIV